MFKQIIRIVAHTHACRRRCRRRRCLYANRYCTVWLCLARCGWRNGRAEFNRKVLRPYYTISKILSADSGEKAARNRLAAPRCAVASAVGDVLQLRERMRIAERVQMALFDLQFLIECFTQVRTQAMSLERDRESVCVSESSAAHDIKISRARNSAITFPDMRVCAHVRTRSSVCVCAEILSIIGACDGSEMVEHFECK